MGAQSSGMAQRSTEQLFPLPDKLGKRCQDQYGWSSDFTERALMGYRQFMRIKVAAADYDDERVPAPPIIQAVWLVHLHYTAHYRKTCDDYCPGHFVHHDPDIDLSEREHESIAWAKDKFGEQVDEDIWSFDVQSCSLQSCYYNCREEESESSEIVPMETESSGDASDSESVGGASDDDDEKEDAKEEQEAPTDIEEISEPSSNNDRQDAEVPLGTTIQAEQKTEQKEKPAASVVVPGEEEKQARQKKAPEAKNDSSDSDVPSNDVNVDQDEERRRKLEKAMRALESHNRSGVRDSTPQNVHNGPVLCDSRRSQRVQLRESAIKRVVWGEESQLKVGLPEVHSRPLTPELEEKLNAIAARIWDDVKNRFHFKGRQKSGKAVFAKMPDLVNGETGYFKGELLNDYVLQVFKDQCPPGIIVTETGGEKGVAFANEGENRCDIHEDDLLGFLLVLSGKKEVYMAHPNFRHTLTQSENQPSGCYEDDPFAKKLDGWEKIDLNPGDGLVIPPKWLHSIRSIAGTVAINIKIDQARHDGTQPVAGGPDGIEGLPPPTTADSSRREFPGDVGAAPRVPIAAFHESTKVAQAQAMEAVKCDAVLHENLKKLCLMDEGNSEKEEDEKGAAKSRNETDDCGKVETNRMSDTTSSKSATNNNLQTYAALRKEIRERHSPAGSGVKRGDNQNSQEERIGATLVGTRDAGGRNCQGPSGSETAGSVGPDVIDLCSDSEEETESENNDLKPTSTEEMDGEEQAGADKEAEEAKDEAERRNSVREPSSRKTARRTAAPANSPVGSAADKEAMDETLEQKKDDQAVLEKQNVRATKVSAKATIPAPPIDVSSEVPVNNNGSASLSEAGRPLEQKKEDQEALEKQNIQATKVSAKATIPAPPIDVSSEEPVNNNGAIVRASLPHQPLSNAKVEDGPRRALKRPAQSRPSACRTMSSRGSRRRNNAFVCGLCSKKIEEKMWALHKNEVIQTQIREHIVCMKCWPITKLSHPTPPPLPRGVNGRHYYQMASKDEYSRYSPGWKPFHFEVPAARSSPRLETTATSTSASEVKCSRGKDSKQDTHIPNANEECSKVAPMFTAATITEGAPARTDHEKEDTPLSQASEECAEMAPTLTNQQPESPKLPTGGAGLSAGAKNSGAVQVQDKCAMVTSTKTSNGLGFGLQTITPARGLLSPAPDQNAEAKDGRDVLMSEDRSLVTPNKANPSQPSLDLQTTSAETSGALAKDPGQETKVFKHATSETMAATPASLSEAGHPLEQKKDDQAVLEKQNVRATKVSAKATIPAPSIDMSGEVPVNNNGPALLSEAGPPLEQKKEDQEAFEKQNVQATKVTAKAMVPAPPIDVSAEVSVNNNGAIVRASLPHQPLSNVKVEDGPPRARKRPAPSRPSAYRTRSSRGSRRRNNAFACGLCSKRIEDVKWWTMHRNEVVQSQIREHIVCVKCWPITEPSHPTPPPLPRSVDGRHYYKMTSKNEYLRFSPGWKPLHF